MRLQQDREADVPLRHGQVVELAGIRFRQLGMRRLFFIVLLELPLKNTGNPLCVNLPASSRPFFS
jgi:hypothetical protein